MLAGRTLSNLLRKQGKGRGNVVRVGNEVVGPAMEPSLIPVGEPFDLVAKLNVTKYWRIKGQKRVASEAKIGTQTMPRPMPAP